MLRERLYVRTFHERPYKIQSSKGVPQNVHTQYTDQTGEFDPGSERTLAAGLTHASRA